jgi:hypothetical protein
MGFGGGGSNATQPHTHDSNIANDGGSLNFNNITQGGMNAGDIAYSDGNHLQILTYPAVPAGETLTAGIGTTAPSWAAAGGGGWSVEGSASSTTATASLTVSGLTNADVYQVVYSVSDDDNGSSALTCVINGDTGANYYNIGINTPAGTGGVGTGRSGVETNDGFFKLSRDQSGGIGHSGVFYIYKANSNFTLGARRGTTMRGIDNFFGSAVAPQYVVSTIGCNASITGAVTSIQLIFQDVSQDIIGDIRVNSLTYA